VLPPGLR